MTDHLEAARDRLGGLHDHLSRREAALTADDLHAILSAILDHLEAQQTEASIQRGLDQVAAGETEALGSFAHYADPDPLDDSNYADRYDCDGVPWRWCDECNGFRMGIRHKPGIGLPVATIDDLCGPLTFAPRPAEPPTAAPQPEQAHGGGDADEPARPAGTHTAPETYDMRLAWLGDEAIGSDADRDFGLWLDNIRAEAWCEGHRAGFADGVHPDDRITPNPYRKDRA